jgi:hypothetical protein
MTFSTGLLLLVGGVGALMPARMGRPCATAAHVRAPACGMVASWYDTGKRLTAGGYGYDPEVKFWPSVGGATGYHRMNGALPATAQFRLGKQSPGDLPPAEQPMAGEAAEPQAARPDNVATAGVAPMPEQMVEWGCDAELWGRMPAGAHRDLARFARDGIEHLARNRTAACDQSASPAHFPPPMGSAPARLLRGSSARVEWPLAAPHGALRKRPSPRRAKPLCIGCSSQPPPKAASNAASNAASKSRLQRRLQRRLQKPPPKPPP